MDYSFHMIFIKVKDKKYVWQIWIIYFSSEFNLESKIGFLYFAVKMNVNIL